MANLVGWVLFILTLFFIIYFIPFYLDSMLPDGAQLDAKYDGIMKIL